MGHRFTLIAVALPVLALAGNIARSEVHRHSEQTWRLAVGGYDPRDLLRGHYLQYQLRPPLEPALERCTDGQDCCLCLTNSADGAYAETRRATCATARAECDAALGTEYLSELRRYYIPEDDARDLETRFRSAASENRAFIVISIDDVGKPHVHHLELDGEIVE